MSQGDSYVYVFVYCENEMHPLSVTL